MHVHRHIDEVVGHAVGLGIPSVQHEGCREVVVSALRLPGLHTVPREIRTAQVAIVAMGEMFIVAQHLVLTTELDDLLEVTEDVGILFQIIPIEPRDLVVLTVGIVVALLGVAHLVAREYHGDTLTDHQQGDGVFHLTVTQGVDVGVVRWTLATTVPTVVMVLAIAVVFAVGLVVLVVIRHKVHQRETVMRRDEVHAGLDATSLLGIEIGRADDTLLDVGEDIRIALDETTDTVTELSVPLGPTSP